MKYEIFIYNYIKRYSTLLDFLSKKKKKNERRRRKKYCSTEDLSFSETNILLLCPYWNS